MEGKNRGEEWTTPVTTACPEAGKLKCEKKTNNWYQVGAIRLVVGKYGYKARVQAVCL